MRLKDASEPSDVVAVTYRAETSVCRVHETTHPAPFRRASRQGKSTRQDAYLADYTISGLASFASPFPAISSGGSLRYPSHRPGGDVELFSTGGVTGPAK